MNKRLSERGLRQAVSQSQFEPGKRIQKTIWAISKIALFDF
jgi:hypothetical protein